MSVSTTPRRPLPHREKDAKEERQHPSERPPEEPQELEELDQSSRRVLDTAPEIGTTDELALRTAELLANPSSAIESLTVASDEPNSLATVTPQFRPVDLKVEITQQGKSWQLAFTPTRWIGIPILGFAAIWDAFLVVWYGIAIKAGLVLGTVMGAFALLHVAAGFYITWFALTRLFNRTFVRIGDGQFTLQPEPIPGKKVSLPLERVLRFEPVQRTSTGKDGTTRSWVVKMLTLDETQQDLPLEFANEEHAAYVAHRLNAIVDESRAPVGYRE